MNTLLYDDFVLDVFGGDVGGDARGSKEKRCGLELKHLQSKELQHGPVLAH
jgi:hypothetical protein